ncbi:MAG TPA: hypothetical protein VJU83_08960 [Burkholderiales bacterium]|nr:hypothetical protein [Burkholderiales bacterium]
MPSTRLLYISAARATLYAWQQGSLVERARFSHDEEGLGAFASELDQESDAIFHVLVDIVEEDFQVDVIPFVRGKDRDALLVRRRTQRYRDASLSMTASLGYERSQRRDERVLLSAFTNIELLEPWLALLMESEAAVSGIYSPGLLAPGMAHALGLKQARVIIVSVHEAGIRQTYLENGKLRFSRLSPLSAEDISDRQRLDIALGSETGRIYQYLRATNALEIDHPPIDVMVIAPPGEADLARRYMPDLPQLRINVVDQQIVASRIGIKSAHSSRGAEPLLMHLLAKRRPRSQYASAGIRKQYRSYQTRLGIVIGGALVSAACLLAAGLTLWQHHKLQVQISEDQAQTDVANAQYRQIEAAFPELPTSRDKLRAAMDQYAQVIRLPSGPEHFSVDLSTALDESPRVELQKMQWRLSTTLPTVLTNAPVREEGARYEILEVEASLNGVAGSDYRVANALVEEFIEKLRLIPGVEIVQTKLPFETGSQESLSTATRQDTAAPRFSVVMARKVSL